MYQAIFRNVLETQRKMVCKDDIGYMAKAHN